MKQIYKNIVKTRLYLLISILFSCLNSLADVPVNPLLYTKNEFVKKGYALRGPVYTVTIKRMTPIRELGQVVGTESELIDSLIFNEKGNISKRYNTEGKYTYEILDDSVFISVSDLKYGSPYTKSVSYKYSSKRISEVKYYKDGKLDARRIFEYTPTGFKSVYYSHSSKEEIFVKKGNEYICSERLSSTGKLNKDGLPISNTVRVPFMADLTTLYSYDNNGNLIKSITQGRVKASDRQRETRYKYVYDKYGNWIERHKYEYGEWLTKYEVREIVYKSPDEILAEKQAEKEAEEQAKKAEKERVLHLEQVLKEKGCAFADKFVKEKKTKYIEELIKNAALFLRLHKPIKSFYVNDDIYSFKFSDTDSASDIHFTYTAQSSHGEALLSSDLRIALVSQYTEQGPEWYVVNYGNFVDFKFNPNDSTNWAKIYTDKFGFKDNVNEDDICRIWQEELRRQWHYSKFYNILKNCYDNCRETVQVYKLTNAYENGFVSPKIMDKSLENKSLEKHRIYKENERKKELCNIALSACKYNERNKPIADKLKKFEIKESAFYFKKKDNSEISNVTFDTVCNGPVFLSSDQTVAMVISQYYDIFIVELDGENIKSVI